MALPLPSETVNQDQYRIPEGIAEISVTNKDLKDAGLNILRQVDSPIPQG